MWFKKWNHFYIDMRPFKRSQNVRISWTLISCVLHKFYFSIHGQCQSNFLRLTEIQNSVFPPNSRIKQDLSYWSTCAKSNATILRNNQTCQLNVTISSDRATMAVKRCEPRSVFFDDKLLSALWTQPTHIRWLSNLNTPTPTLQPQHSNPNTPTPTLHRRWMRQWHEPSLSCCLQHSQAISAVHAYSTAQTSSDSPQDVLTWIVSYVFICHLLLGWTTRDQGDCCGRQAGINLCLSLLYTWIALEKQSEALIGFTRSPPLRKKHDLHYHIATHCFPPQLCPGSSTVVFVTMVCWNSQFGYVRSNVSIIVSKVWRVSITTYPLVSWLLVTWRRPFRRACLLIIDHRDPSSRGSLKTSNW